VPCSKLYQSDESDLRLLMSQAQGFAESLNFSWGWQSKKAVLSAPGHPFL